jgi:hypothetical protein
MIWSLVACSGKTVPESGNVSQNNPQQEKLSTIPETTEAKEEVLPKEIEMTLDNWQDYLELKYMVGWNYNAFDEIEGFSYIYPVLALKEDFAGRTVSKNTELAVGFTATELWKTASADIESKTYEWGEESGVKEKEVVSDTAKFYAEGLGSNARILKEGGIVILNPFSKHGNGVVSYPYYEDFEITRIEGTLIFE